MTRRVPPELARRTWRSFEAVHGMIYFTPDAPAAYAEVGVDRPRTGYFGSRSAPMGPVGPEVVIATFHNFHPGLVRHAMAAGTSCPDGVWTRTSPAALVEARLRAADVSLRRALGDEVLASEELALAAAQLRRVALAACERPEGRPLFAGHASLAWPDEDHLVLWHAQTLLREFRGDGHVAALVLEDLDGLGALISHAASGDVPARVLQATRAWSDDEWRAGVAAMADRGLVHDDGSATVEGRAQRDRIEHATDAAAAGPFGAIGATACEELLPIGARLSGLVVRAGLLPG